MQDDGIMPLPKYVREEQNANHRARLLKSLFMEALDAVEGVGEEVWPEQILVDIHTGGVVRLSRQGSDWETMRWGRTCPEGWRQQSWNCANVVRSFALLWKPNTHSFTSEIIYARCEEWVAQLPEPQASRAREILADIEQHVFQQPEEDQDFSVIGADIPDVGVNPQAGRGLAPEPDPALDPFEAGMFSSPLPAEFTPQKVSPQIETFEIPEEQTRKAQQQHTGALEELSLEPTSIAPAQDPTDPSRATPRSPAPAARQRSATSLPARISELLGTHHQMLSIIEEDRLFDVLLREFSGQDAEIERLVTAELAHWERNRESRLWDKAGKLLEDVGPDGWVSADQVQAVKNLWLSEGRLHPKEAERQTFRQISLNGMSCARLAERIWKPAVRAYLERRCPNNTFSKKDRGHMLAVLRTHQIPHAEETLDDYLSTQGYRRRWMIGGVLNRIMGILVLMPLLGHAGTDFSVEITPGIDKVHMDDVEGSVTLKHTRKLQPDNALYTVQIRIADALIGAPPMPLSELESSAAEELGVLLESMRKAELLGGDAVLSARQLGGVLRNTSPEGEPPRQPDGQVWRCREVLALPNKADTLDAAVYVLLGLKALGTDALLAAYPAQGGEQFGVLLPEQADGASPQGSDVHPIAGRGVLLLLHPDATPTGELLSSWPLETVLAGEWVASVEDEIDLAPARAAELVPATERSWYIASAILLAALLTAIGGTVWRRRRRLQEIRAAQTAAAEQAF